VLIVVALGEMPNPNPLLCIKFHGSKHLIRRGLVGVIPEILKINHFHVLYFCHTMQFLFNIILGYLNDLNKFCHFGQSCRGIEYLSLEIRLF